MIQQLGIPGTIDERTRRLKWIRVEHLIPDSRAYRTDDDSGFLVALVTHDLVEEGKKLWHLSVSHRDKDDNPDRCPTWDELKHAMYRLVQADVPMVLILPRRSTPANRYVDIHPTTLHLWKAEGDIDQ